MGKYTMDMDAIKAETKRGRSFMELKDGTNNVRILPRENGTFFVKGFVHYGVGVENKTLFCPERAETGDRCYICKLARRYRKEGLEDEAKALYPKVRFYSAAINLDLKNPTVEVLGYGVQLMDKFNTYLTMPDYGPELMDPESGRDWVIKKENLGGGKQNVRYDAVPRGTSTPIANELWLEEVEDALAGIVSYESYERQKQIMDGDSDDDEETSAAPAPSAHAAAPTPTPVRTATVSAGDRFCTDCGLVQATKFCGECGEKTEVIAAPGEEVPAPAPAPASTGTPLSERLARLRSKAS